jgi:hypothetical protein
MVALDLTKAFDSVDHHKLVETIFHSTLPPSQIRWLSNYLRGRQARTSFRDSLSSARIIHTGVPQGSVISPALFNAYISEFPEPPPGVKVVSYADDINIYATDPKYKIAAAKLNNYLAAVADFLDERLLSISTSKSSVTLFTPDTKEANDHPEVSIRGDLLPLNERPKVLGVTFDKMFTFADHCRATAGKVDRRNNILRALAGTDWGQQKETLLVTFKAIGRSITNYGAPIWSPVASDTSVKKLQVAQNNALRVATGCHRMSSIHHLHQETDVLPVQQHCSMLAAQYLAGCRMPEHPCHDLVNHPAPKRPLKGTLHSYAHGQLN